MVTKSKPVETYTAIYEVPFHACMRMNKNGNPVTTLEIPIRRVEPESVDQLVRLVIDKFGVEEFAVEGVLIEIERLAILSILSKSMVAHFGKPGSEEPKDEFDDL
jgi:hypothetical protein